MMIRRQLIVMPALAVLLLGLVTQAAGDTPPPTLSDDLIRGAAVSEAQREQIGGFVEHWVQSMVPSEGAELDPQQVIAARTQLVRPFERGPSAAFRTAYEQTLANALPALFDRPEVLVRINAALVVVPMRTDAILIPAGRAVADAAPAVRYWGARSLRLLGESELQQTRFWLSNVAEPIQIAILDMLEPRLAGEPSADVLREMSFTIVVLSPDQADRVLVQAFGERIRLFAENPSIGPAGIGDVLGQITRNRLRLTSTPPSDQLRREAMLVNYRYLLLVRDILQRAEELELDSRTLEQWRNLAGRNHVILREWAATVDRDNLPGDFPGGQVNPETLTDRINAWRTLLSRAPYNVPVQALQPNL